MAEDTESLEAEATSLAGRPLDEEAIAVLQRAGLITACRPDYDPNSPPVEWLPVVLALFMSEGPVGRWLTWGREKKGYFEGIAFLTPAELSTTMDSEAGGGQIERSLDGWFTNSIRLQLPKAGRIAAAASTSSETAGGSPPGIGVVHLLASFFLEPVGEHPNELGDLEDPGSSSKNHVAEFVADLPHLFDTADTFWTGVSIAEPWEDVDDALRRAIEAQDPGNTTPANRATGLLPAMARAGGADGALSSDPAAAWFARTFGHAFDGGRPGSGELRSPLLGRHTLLKRARALAELVSPGEKVGSAHLIGAAVAADGADLPPSLHILPPPLGKDPAVAWTNARIDFLQIVGGPEPGADMGAWIRLIFGESRPNPSLADDGLPSVDLLNFSRYANAFATVIADREVKAPLAIGLFGPWGSGKSAMMRMIGDALGLIARRASLEKAGKPRFCSGIVQVTFNAWHYAETTLWASLFVRILEQLGSHLSGPADEASRDDTPTRAPFEREKAVVELRVAVLEGQGAKAALLTAEIAAAKAEEDRKAAEQAELKAREKAAAELAEMSGQVSRTAKDTMEDARRLLGTLGRPVAEVVVGEGALDQLDAWRMQLGESIAEYRAAKEPLARVAIIRGWDLWAVKLVLISAAAVGLILIAALVVRPSGGLVAGLLAVTAAFATIVARLKPLTDAAQRALEAAPEAIRKLKEESQKIIESEAKKQQAEIDKATRRESDEARQRIAESVSKVKEAEAARTKLNEIQTKIIALETRISELAPDRLLKVFVEARASSVEYTRHLGLPTQIRRDIEGLGGYLRNLVPPADQSSDRPSFKRIDRIVLFIDDLDRCQPDVVVAVLEAVHILLATDLFVVVVGVDVRWLKRSLEARFHRHSAYEAFDPEEYLEKIFQVPFWIPAMEAAGRRALLDAALPAVAGPAGQQQPGGGGETTGGSEGTGTSRSAGPEAETQSARDAPLPPADPVTLTPEELDALHRWGALSGDTPRRLKRFARSYLILRASLSRDSQQALNLTGDYNTVARLLAFGAAAPGLSPLVEPVLAKDRKKWETFFGVGSTPPSQQNIRRWIPEVERFGFGEPKGVDGP